MYYSVVETINLYFIDKLEACRNNVYYLKAPNKLKPQDLLHGARFTRTMVCYANSHVNMKISFRPPKHPVNCGY